MKGVTGLPRGLAGGLGKMGDTKSAEIRALNAVYRARTSVLLANVTLNVASTYEIKCGREVKTRLFFGVCGGTGVARNSGHTQS